jgi:energy-coupling factor transporter ATP-binding protein EcfA2
VTTAAAELLGPPGSGKSTLLAALAEHQNRMRYVDRARTWRGVPYLLGGAAAAAPWVLGERTTWQQTRWIVRVEAAALLVRRAAPPRTPSVVFAQGPVYSLARLSGSNFMTPRLTDWRSAKTRQLAGLLDVVVVLDAPDDVLLRRIWTREKAHALKRVTGDSERVALVRFRSALESTLAELTSDGGPEVLCFDTSRTSVAVMTESLLDVLRVRQRA